MVSKILALTVAGDDLYAQVVDAGGNAYNGSGLEPFQDANWGHYALPLPPSSAGSRLYQAAFPASLPAGRYGVLIYRQAGPGPAATDLLVASGPLEWDGTQEVALATRSTYSGGPVTLAAAGLDAVAIEAGVNARQALSAVLASAAGVLLGAGTGTVIIKGGTTSATRITASTDNAGNRSALTLSLPS